MLAPAQLAARTLESSVAAAQGKRPTMEDCHVRIDSLWRLMGSPAGIDRYPRAGFYAVYDGHGGRRAAEVAASMLHSELTKRLFQLGPDALLDEALVRDALLDAFAATEAEVVARATARADGQWEDGSTACAVLILGNRLFAANLGDSRAVLSRAGTARALTVDHKPGTEEEERRIHRAGGYVRLVGGIERVMGDLSVSRAFGDVEYKPNIVSPVPDVSVVPLGADDEFVIVACDGLWDVLSEQDAVDEAHRRFRSAPGAGLQAVADGLVNAALRRIDCDDNVSVVVVAFDALVEGLRARATGGGGGGVARPAKLASAPPDAGGAPLRRAAGRRPSAGAAPAGAPPRAANPPPAVPRASPAGRREPRA
ncbi:hypothetical protein KFE25_009356 [Diacronema lutheri]|uniref:PPM-type phosphatase domain-containing protein n=2 Tax=Diacronema lutheri TaxID=2081491 RepID=A0A8J5Y3L2_DIALT|nr:hypothetical protein KFE25_009356 [Diacronema lutheri]